jgi:predicted O-methyltransferase YrrM
MLVNYATEDLYSIEYLSQKFQVTLDEIDKVVTTKNLSKQQNNGKLYIQKSEIRQLIDELFPDVNDDRGYEIPEYLQKSTSPWAKTLVKMYRENFTYPASVSPSQGEFLKSLMCNIAPKNVVEIGCFTGISTIWLAAGLEQNGGAGNINSIDLFEDIIPAPPYHRAYLPNPIAYAQNSVAAAELAHRVKFHKSNSVAAGERIHEILTESIDFIYIDGDHTKSGCEKDFMLFYPHVAIGGYIVLHDIYPEYCNWDGPRYVIDKYIKNSPHFQLMEVKTSPVNYGMAVMRKLSQDKNLELRDKLKNTAIWNLIKGKPLGNFIKNRLS